MGVRVHPRYSYPRGLPESSMSRLRFIPTPNPNSLKIERRDGGTFPIDGMLTAGTLAEAQRANSAMAEAVLQLEGVASVFGLPAFVTVSKKPSADWDALLPALEPCLERFL